MKQKIIHVLLALLASFCIWIYVVTVVSPESEATYYNIPVVLNNESVLMEKGLMVVSDDAPTVTLQLRGNRSDLNSLKNSDITLIADLSKINGAGEQLLSYDISFTGSGSNNAYEVLNQSPGYITLQIAEWATKDVPVNVTYSGSLGLEYIAYNDEVTLDRTAITLTGPKSVVDQITQAMVVVDLDGQTDTISQSYRYTLCDENGDPVDAATVKTNAAEVNLTLKIHRVKELQLLLDVTYGGGASQSNTSIVLEQETIKVAGSTVLLDSLGDTLTIGSVDLSKISEEETVLTFEIKLPEGVRNLSNVKTVNVTVTFPGLTTATMYVPNSSIVLVNIPEGLTAEVAAKQVELTLRGPTELMEALQAEDIKVLIDLTGGALGDQLYKPTVEMSDAYSEIGTIQIDPILVTLTETAAVEE